MATSIITALTPNYGTMLQTLRVRCGINPTVGAAGALADILTEAHEYVYGELDDGHPCTSVLTLQPNVATYPWEVTADNIPIARGSVQEIWIERGSADRWPLSQGINHAMRADAALRSIPERWDDQFAGADQTVWTLEVWPTPDQAYPLYIDHRRVLTRFSDPADLPSAPYRLVLGYAVALGKAHYGKADAETSGQAFQRMLYKEKVRQKESKRFLPPTSFRPARPRVVATSGGYRQVWE